MGAMVEVDVYSTGKTMEELFGHGDDFSMVVCLGTGGSAADF
jgi:hypothetical protein